MNEREALEVQLLGDLENMKRIALYLFDVIDAIDTYGDMVKDDDKLFRKLALRKTSERFRTGIVSGGYGERVEWIEDFHA